MSQMTEARDIVWDIGEHYPERFPFWERYVTFGRVEGSTITFAQNKVPKDQMLRTAEEDMKNGVVFFVAWTGKWSTDLFKWTVKDITQALKDR